MGKSLAHPLADFDYDDCDLAAEIENVENEITRLRWRDNPADWVRERLGEFIWSKQVEILNSLRDNRRTAVPSCHEVGKSFIAARCIGWWIDTLPLGQAFVVTSAPTAPQVEAILWREFGRVHAKGLPGRLNQTEWLFQPEHGKEELIAFGRKPADQDPTAFQGIHAPYVLFLLDEACGIPDSLWEAADSLIANDNSKALVIGNPDDPLTRFRRVCMPGSGWNVCPIGAFDTPNFTGEYVPPFVAQQLIGKVYVEEKRRQWAPSWNWVDAQGTVIEVERPEHVPEAAVKVVCPEREDPQDTDPFWQSKVLGLFPKTSGANALINENWIIAAQLRKLSPLGKNELGVDVGAGGDASCLAHRRGQVVRIRWEDHNPDTMLTCGKVNGDARDLGVKKIKVDSIGIGKGMADRGRELKRTRKIEQDWVPINVGEAVPGVDKKGVPLKNYFTNLRAYYYWNVREAFERGEIDIDPLDLQLAHELVNLRYHRTSSGKIEIEQKKDMKKRLNGLSPNRAEALMLSLAEPPSKGALDGKLTW